MEISYSNLKKYALLYVTLPMFIFFVGYLKWYLAFICCLALVFSLYKALEQPNTRDDKRFVFFINNRTINITFFVVLLWAYLGGLNGFYFQSNDWTARNAIFHDLIDFDWPVKYMDESGNEYGLVYYIGYWLPAAVLGKFFNFIGNGNDTLTWFAAKQMFWIWAALGLFLVLLLLFVLLKATSVKKRVIIALFFVFFSGMDILGCISFDTVGLIFDPLYIHIEWWSRWYQYSSMTTCLFWVFNQTIITWICVMCFLLEKDPRNYLLIGMACLFSGPIPFVGLVLLMIGKGFEYFIKKARVKEIKEAVNTIVSRQNIVTTIFVFPIIGSYFLSNTAVNTGSTNTIQWPTFPEYMTSKTFWLFWLFEVGIYLILILKKYYKKPLYYFVFFSLFFIPYFHLGEAGDFCMRASLPALFILMIMCESFVFDLFSTSKNDVLTKVCGVALSICLIVGMITPIVEFARGLYYVEKYKTVCLEKDIQRTLNGDFEADNFLTSNPDDVFFFKYFAK